MGNWSKYLTLLALSAVSMALWAQIPLSLEPKTPVEPGDNCRIQGQVVLSKDLRHERLLVVEKCQKTNLKDIPWKKVGLSQKDYLAYLKEMRKRTNGLKHLRELQVGHTFEDFEQNILSLRQPRGFESRAEHQYFLRDMVNVLNADSRIDEQLIRLQLQEEGAAKPSPGLFRWIARENSRKLKHIRTQGCAHPKVSSRGLHFGEAQFEKMGKARLFLHDLKEHADQRFVLKNFNQNIEISFTPEGTFYRAEGKKLKLISLKSISAQEAISKVRPFGWEHATESCFLQELIRQ